MKQIKRFLFLLLSLVANYQIADVIAGQQIVDTNKFENYSKTDWEGQGIFRNFKPENEIPALRTRTSKHFLNSDGTVTALLMAGSSINYEESGKWRTITKEIERNYSIESIKYPFANTHNAFKSYYPAVGGFDGIQTVLKEGVINEWVNPQMYYLVNGEKVNVQKINKPDVKINANEIIYKNIFDYVDVKFIQNNDSRKMDIVLNNSFALSNAPANATDLVFEEAIKLPEKWTTNEEEGCINVYDENNFWISRYEKPVFFDCGKKSSERNENKISGNYYLSNEGNILKILIKVPARWLNSIDRVFPVFIDPTISIYPANTNYYTGTIYRIFSPSSFTKYNDSLYQIHSNTASWYYGFLKFDIFSLTQASSISSAYINLHCYGASITGINNGYLRGLSNDPVTTPAHTLFTGYSAVLSPQFNCSSCWYNWILPLNEDVNIFNRINNQGWVAYAVDCGHPDWFSFDGYSSPNYKPFLTITYCITPGTPTNLTAISSGMSSVNLSWSAGTPIGSPTVRYYWEVYTTGGVFVGGNNTTSTSTPVSGLSAGTSYFFRVQANTTCDNSWSAWDTSAVFSTLSCTSPGVPTNLSSFFTSQTSSIIQWSQGAPTGSPSLFYNWEIYSSSGVLFSSGSTTGTNENISSLNCGTTYYFRVRAGTTCDSSYSQWAISPNFSLTTIQPSWLATDKTSFCSDDAGNINLSSSGGSGDIFNWYSGACNSLVIGTGTVFTLPSPTNSTTFFANWNIIGCSPSACLSVTVDVYDAPVAPTYALTDRNNFCSNAGGNITLTASGGSGTTVKWYRLGCSGTLVGTGNPKIIPAPVQTTTYWCLWQTSGCSNSSCASRLVIVLSTPVASANVSSNFTNICFNSGGTITLSGSGGSGTTFGWYNGSCGGSIIETGKILTIVKPTVTTTYWGRYESTSCGNSSCKSVTVNVINSVPQQPDTIIGNITPFVGSYEVYRVTDVQGESYFWSAPSGWTGTSSSNSISFQVGLGTGTITVTPSNSCGTGLSRTLNIIPSMSFYSINGYFNYNNSVLTPMDSVWVFRSLNGSIIDSVQADSNGYYYINNVQNGMYNITAKTNKNWAGVNSTDAVKVKRHFAGSELFTSSIRLHSADPNLSFNINVTDAVKITRRYVGSDTYFDRGDWVFEKPFGGDTLNVSTYLNDTVIVNGHNVTQNFLALCVGDVNCSNVPLPAARPKSKVDFSLENNTSLIRRENEEFELPVFATSEMNVGAMSMILKFPKELVTIDNLQLIIDNGKIENRIMNNGEDNLFYNIVGDELRIGWFASVGAFRETPNTPFIIISGKTTNNFKHGDVIQFKIANNPLCEFADENGEPIENVVLKTYSIEYSNGQNIEIPASSLNNELLIFPNPAEYMVNIRYYIVNDGFVNISLYNVLGEKVVDFVNNPSLKGTYSSEYSLSLIPPGIYSIKMKLNEKTVVVKRLVISK